MKSSQSSDDSSELIDRIEVIKKKNTRLRGSRDQIIRELRDLGYKTEKAAEDWVEGSADEIERLDELVRTETKKVRAQLDEYDRQSEEE